jgi:hypothetical protein
MLPKCFPEGQLDPQETGQDIAPYTGMAQAWIKSKSMQKLILGASSLKFEERDPVTLRMIALQ